MNDSSHFYDIHGNAVFEVPNKSKGGMRGTTLKDAKKMALLPSVTTYFKCLHKKSLVDWQLRQVAWAATTLPRKDKEDDEAFIARIVVDAFEQVQDAADKGSLIHGCLENHFQGKPYDPSIKPYVDLVDEWAKKHKVEWLDHELRLVNTKYGYAGTTDALAIIDGKRTLIDYKTRKSRPEYKMTPWSTEPMQLAAYANCPGMEIEQAVNIFISSTEMGRLEDAWYPKEQLDEEFEAFKHLIKVWSHFNGYCAAEEAAKQELALAS